MSNEQPQEHISEVARLLQQIQEEYEAAQRGLTGLALGTAQHEFITKRMEGIEEARENLEHIVGPDEAMRLVVQQLESPHKTEELKNEGEQ